MKASIVFLRRLAVGESLPADTPIFMALAENIGYDATGRKTFQVVQADDRGNERIEIQRCDFFDYRVYYDWSTTDPKRPGWSERHREIIPDTGLVARWREFERNPSDFFV